jgi:hypothetical protein
MQQQDYQRTITANIPPGQAFDRICRVPEWWTQGFTGRAQGLGDTFTVRFGETFVDFRISELVRGKKIVWQVSDSNLHWVKDKKEWNGTEVVWEISSANGTTTLQMMHRGLVPGVECYERCKSGWDFCVGDSLLKLLTEGEGRPDQGSR